jgi:hypothetical protein
MTKEIQSPKSETGDADGRNKNRIRIASCPSLRSLRLCVIQDFQPQMHNDNRSASRLNGG